MRFNRTRHKLLRKLAEKFRLNNDYKEKNADVVGLSLKEIESILGKHKKHRDFILSELGKSKEIQACNLSEKGFFITPSEGLSAFAAGKYIRKNNDILINGFKTFNAIAIPILSLAVAVLALTIKLEPTDMNAETKVIQNNTKALERIESRLVHYVSDKKEKADSDIETTESE